MRSLASLRNLMFIPSERLLMLKSAFGFFFKGFRGQKNAFAIALLLTGCQLGPKYEAPVTQSPDEWKVDPKKELPDPCVSFWWEIFEDQTLNALEQQAIAENPDIYIALDRVAQARALAGVEKADLYPQINLNPTYNNTGILFKIFTPKGIFPPNENNNLDKPFRIHQQLYTLPFNMNYELDLWGKLRSQYRSAKLSAEAEMDRFYSALLTLTADVASHYFQLRLLDTQVMLVRKNWKLANQSLKIAKQRKEKGLTSEIDVLSIEQQVLSVQGTLYDLKKQREVEENALAILIGLPPLLYRIEDSPLFSAPPEVPANLPSEVLMQRPDIAAAERMMASEHALIGVAYASFFPSIALTGSLGFSSPTFKDFLTWKSRLWSIGANIFESIFDGGRNQANLNLTYARFYEASHNYQKVVLIAFQEVENALSSLEWEALQYETYRQAVEVAYKQSSIASRRYRGGLGNYLELLNSERAALEADLNASNLLGLRYLTTVQLIKAIGGGWVRSP